MEKKNKTDNIYLLGYELVLVASSKMDEYDILVHGPVARSPRMVSDGTQSR